MINLAGKVKKMVKKLPYLQMILLLCIAVFLSSCSFGTVKPFLKSPEYQSENLPVRTLRILAMTDGTHPQPQIAQTISKCSQISEEQVGIRLEIVDWKEIKLNSGLPRAKILKKVAKESLGDRNSFDIVIAFTGFKLLGGDGIKLALFGTAWLGLIDDTYRRYIIVKLLDPFIILHELFHGFIFSVEHSMRGIMTTGFYPIGRKCLWLGIEDRKEVLMNKYRDFNIKIHPSPEGGVDFIEEPENICNSENVEVQTTY
jgi:hypothetical protein